VKRGVAALVGIAAAVFGLQLIPPTDFEMGPATVSTRARTGPGQTLLEVPPLGTIIADTHGAPLELEVSIARLDVERLADLATSPEGRERLRAEVEADLRAMTVMRSIQLLIGAALLGAIAGLAVYHRQVGPILVSTGAAVAIVALGLSLTGQAYRVEAFEEPRFTGTLTRARQVIETVNQQIGVLDEARSRFQVATRRVSDLLTLLAEPQRDVRSDSTAILHVSDIHGNPLGVDITAQLVEEFQAEAVIDTGDMASSFLDTGELSTLSQSVEASIVRGIADIGVPYVFVPGNHDSFGLRGRLAEIDNVQVLAGDTTTVAGLSVLGWADPTFTTRPVPEVEKSEIRQAEAEEVAAAVAAEEPDILAVHDEILASGSLGGVPLVLSGHTHEHDIEEIEGTIVLTIGSTGATGLKSLTVETERDYEAEVLYFVDNVLVAVDFVALRGAGGEFELERHAF